MMMISYDDDDEDCGDEEEVKKTRKKVNEKQELNPAPTRTNNANHNNHRLTTGPTATSSSSSSSSSSISVASFNVLADDYTSILGEINPNLIDIEKRSSEICFPSYPLDADSVVVCSPPLIEEDGAAISTESALLEDA